jgi:uncharacterized membrane-anchored protein
LLDRSISPPGPSLADGDVDAEKAPLAAVPRLERRAIAAAVGLQLVVLLAMILGRTVPYLGARTVLLRVVPVDPRDIFKGDYVILGYDISRIPYGQFQPGDPVFALLAPEADGLHYHADKFLKAPPTEGVFVQGTTQNGGRATYGIESFYVQETTGHDYERAVRQGGLSAEVALDGQGRPALRRLVIE